MNANAVTATERAFILERYGKVPARHIAQETGRTERTIRKVARAAGLTNPDVSKWKISSQEADFILANYQTMPSCEMARQIDRPRQTICDWFRRRRLTAVSARRDVSGDEQFVKANWLTMTDAQLGAKIGRTVDGIAKLRSRLGLIRSRQAGTYCRIVRETTRLIRTADNRPLDAAQRAADYLASFDRTPVFRIDDKGQPSPKGKLWRYGCTRLTTDEMMAKAARKGFDPDAWRRLAA